MEAPTGKGKCLIILHAGFEGGFLPKCSLICVGKYNNYSIDYHDEMNGDHFEEWLEHKFLPNLLASAAVVIDNALHHTVKTKESWAPTLTTRKADFQVWLSERAYLGHQTCLKVSLKLGKEAQA